MSVEVSNLFKTFLALETFKMFLLCTYIFHIVKVCSVSGIKNVILLAIQTPVLSVTAGFIALDSP